MKWDYDWFPRKRERIIIQKEASYIWGFFFPCISRVAICFHNLPIHFHTHTHTHTRHHHTRIAIYPDIFSAILFLLWNRFLLLPNRTPPSLLILFYHLRPPSPPFFNACLYLRTRPQAYVAPTSFFFFRRLWIFACSFVWLPICSISSRFFFLSLALPRPPPFVSILKWPNVSHLGLAFQARSRILFFFFRSFSIILFLFSFYLYFFFPFSSRVCYLGSPLSSVMKLNERLILSLLIHYLLVWRWGGSSCLGWGIHIVHVSLYIFFVDSL